MTTPKTETNVAKVAARHAKEMAAAVLADRITAALPSSVPPPRKVHARNLYGVAALVCWGDDYGFASRDALTIDDAAAIAAALPANVGTISTWTDGCRYHVPTFYAAADADHKVAKSHAHADDRGDVTILADLTVTHDDPAHGVKVSWHHKTDAGDVLKIELALRPSFDFVDRRIYYAKTPAGNDSRRVEQDSCYDRGDLSAASWSCRFHSGRDNGTSRHELGWYDDDTAAAVTPAAYFARVAERLAAPTE